MDGLLKLKSRSENEGMWKIYIMSFMSVSMAMNIFILRILIEQIFKIKLFDIGISAFSIGKINSFFSFFILYLLLPIILNYFLIFNGNRFERLIGKYKYYNGKLFAAYFMISLFSPFVLAILAAIFE